MYNSFEKLSNELPRIGKVSMVDHISFDIEEQERILRAHILGSNLIQKDRSNMFGATQEDGKDDQEMADTDDVLQIGNIYKFNQNRNYYDSLESVEVLRNEQPEFIEDQISQGESKQMDEDSDESQLRRK